MTDGLDDQADRRRRQVMALPTLPIRRETAVTASAAGDRLVRFSVGAQEDLQALWCAGDDWDALFPLPAARSRETGHGRTLRPVDVRLSSQRANQTTCRTIPSLTLAFPPPGCCCPTTTSSWATRASGGRPAPERNAIRYDEHNQVVADETWGDDICQLAVAADDTIWAGYRTMATAGTGNGWGGPGPAATG